MGSALQTAAASSTVRCFLSSQTGRKERMVCVRFSTNKAHYCHAIYTMRSPDRREMRNLNHHVVLLLATAEL